MAMPLISVEDYLRACYEPDAEYVDGVIEERPAGEQKHSAWQTTLLIYLGTRVRAWGMRVRGELRTKTGERRYRVPDAAVLDAAAPLDDVTVVPPLAAFEVLSPEDRLGRLFPRLADFESMGVPAVYLIDPVDHSCFRYQAAKLEAVSEFMVGSHAISVQDIVDSIW